MFKRLSIGRRSSNADKPRPASSSLAQWSVNHLSGDTTGARALAGIPDVDPARGAQGGAAGGGGDTHASSADGSSPAPAFGSVSAASASDSSPFGSTAATGPGAASATSADLGLSSKGSTGSTGSTDAAGAAEPMRVLHTFDARGKDELSVVVGTLVSVVARHADGWCVVRCGANEGLVPENFLVAAPDAAAAACERVLLRADSFRSPADATRDGSGNGGGGGGGGSSRGNNNAASSSASTATSPRPAAAVVAKLTALYQERNPEKIASIPQILQAYDGNWEWMFTQLYEKYGITDAIPRFDEDGSNCTASLSVSFSASASASASVSDSPFASPFASATASAASTAPAATNDSPFSRSAPLPGQKDTRSNERTTPAGTHPTSAQQQAVLGMDGIHVPARRPPTEAVTPGGLLKQKALSQKDVLAVRQMMVAMKDVVSPSHPSGPPGTSSRSSGPSSLSPAVAGAAAARGAGGAGGGQAQQRFVPSQGGDLLICTQPNEATPMWHRCYGWFHGPAIHFHSALANPGGGASGGGTETEMFRFESGYALQSQDRFANWKDIVGAPAGGGGALVEVRRGEERRRREKEMRRWRDEDKRGEDKRGEGRAESKMREEEMRREMSGEEHPILGEGAPQQRARPPLCQQQQRAPPCHVLEATVKW